MARSYRPLGDDFVNFQMDWVEKLLLRFKNSKQLWRLHARSITTLHSRFLVRHSILRHGHHRRVYSDTSVDNKVSAAGGLHTGCAQHDGTCNITEVRWSIDPGFGIHSKCFSDLPTYLTKYSTLELCSSVRRRARILSTRLPSASYCCGWV